MAKSPGNRVGINMGYCCAVRIRTNSMAIAADGAKGPPFSTVLATTTRRARKKCSDANAEILKCRQGGSTRRAIEVIDEVRQEGLESRGAAEAGGHPFLQLGKQIVNKAMQIVGIITIGGDRGFVQFQKRRVPSGDPNGRGQSHRSSGIGDIKDSGEGEL